MATNANAHKSIIIILDLLSGISIVFSEVVIVNTSKKLSEFCVLL